MTNKGLYFLIIFMYVIGGPQAIAAPLSPSGAGIYKDFVSNAIKDRGVAASVDADQFAKLASAGIDFASVFRLYESSDFDAASEKLGDQIAEIEKLNDPRLQAIAVDFRGLIRQRRGDYALAMQNHERALELLGEATGTAEGVAIRNNLAVANFFLGEYGKSERLLSDIAESAGPSPTAKARAYNNRGLIRAEIGEHDKALADFYKAETEARDNSSPPLLAEILNNQGRLWTLMQNDVRARDALNEALILAQSGSDPALLANVLDSWGEHLLGQKEFAGALTKLDEAIKAEARATTPLVKAMILKNRARALAGLGRLQEAQASIDEVIAIASNLEVSALRRDALAVRAAIHSKAGRVNDAIADYRSAIAIAERSRERLPQESETAFFGSIASLYRDFVVLLTKRRNPGDTEEAFGFLERSNVASLQEQTVSAQPDLRDEQAKRDIEGTRGILRKEAALAQRLHTLKSTPGAPPAEIVDISKRLELARKEATDALGELKSKYDGRFDRYLPAPISSLPFRKIQQYLPPKSLLVSYVLVDDGLYIFLVSNERGAEFRQNSNITRAELEQHIDTYRELITGHKHGDSRESYRIDSFSDPQWHGLREETTWLYDQLLGPISEQLKQAEHVIFAPAGKLYYLPFQALGPKSADSRQIEFLALKKKVSYIAAASLIETFSSGNRDSAKRKAPSRILAFGDVRFAPPLAQLDASKVELQSIRNIFGASATILSGENATKDRLMKAFDDAKDYRHVLISTHGIVDSRDPRSSHLALENGKKLQAQEIAKLDLTGVGLVALSACKTGLAGTNPGAGLMSLGDHFSQAGASSVVVTLWNVDDFQTAALMKHMFTGLKQNANDRAGALQRAQIALASKPESRHPYFWSPFTLYGRAW